MPGDLVAVALVVCADEIRPDAADTIAFFGAESVTTKVISGDNPRTVAAIAARCGVPSADRWIDARTLPEDAEQLSEQAKDIAVFGRVTPDVKRSLVKAAQSHGEVVAMTGDGVNDTLALKDADLGIAMGSGTSAAKSVAELVLLDNRFATLPGVVAEGRRVIANIERVARPFVTKTVWAATFAVIIGVFTTSYPLLPRQLTVVDGLTIGIPGFVLSFQPSHEPARPGFLSRVVRFCAPVGIVIGVVTMGVFAVLRSAGVGADPPRGPERDGARADGARPGRPARADAAARPAAPPLLVVLVVMGIGAFTHPVRGRLLLAPGPGRRSGPWSSPLGIVIGAARGGRGGPQRGPHRRRRHGGRREVPPVSWFRPIAPSPALRDLLDCRYVAVSAGHHDLLPDGCMDLVWTADLGVMLCGPDTAGWSFDMPPACRWPACASDPGPRAASSASPPASSSTDVWRSPTCSAPGGAPVDRRAGGRRPTGAARMAVFEELVRRAVPTPSRRSRWRRSSPPTPGRRSTTWPTGPASRRASCAAGSTAPSGTGRRSSPASPGSSASPRARCGPGPGIAELATAAGYADQAHLAKDVRAFADRTPRELLGVLARSSLAVDVGRG